jgi:hypothetical protein
VTRVINKRSDEYLTAKNTVYIGRGSKWGNQFIMGMDGDRAEVIQLYREWFLERIEGDPAFMRETMKLKDKTLVCYCKPLPCHGDAIAEWLDRNDDIVLSKRSLARLNNMRTQYEMGF